VPRVGFEPKILVFVRAKIFYSLYGAVTVKMLVLNTINMYVFILCQGSYGSNFLLVDYITKLYLIKLYSDECENNR
jgi:hypothetical protein